MSEGTALIQKNQEIATVKKPRDIRDLIESDQFKSAVKAALPKCLKPERFIRVALNATMRHPELLQCTKESFFRCMLDLSSYGLEPDGRRAHLIPFNTKVNFKDEQGRERERWEKQVQLIIDYKGIAELVRRSGDASYLHADIVCEGDEWAFQYGTGAFMKHVPNFERRSAGAKVIAAYSFVRLKDGNEDFMVLGKSEVDAVRDRSKSKNSGPWVTDWNEMAKKTAFRRHSKWLPLSPEVQDVVRADEEADTIDTGGLALLSEQADLIQGAVSLESLKSSEDANRGHGDTTATDEPANEAQS